MEKRKSKDTNIWFLLKKGFGKEDAHMAYTQAIQDLNYRIITSVAKPTDTNNFGKVYIGLELSHEF